MTPTHIERIELVAAATLSLWHISTGCCIKSADQDRALKSGTQLADQ
jgi:hypothetical protein